jgi:hypothetical protein
MIKMSYSGYRFPPEIIYRVGLVWRTYGEAHLSHDAVQAANPARLEGAYLCRRSPMWRVG